MVVEDTWGKQQDDEVQVLILSEEMHLMPFPQVCRWRDKGTQALNRFWSETFALLYDKVVILIYRRWLWWEWWCLEISKLAEFWEITGWVQMNIGNICHTWRFHTKTHWNDLKKHTSEIFANWCLIHHNLPYLMKINFVTFSRWLQQ